MSLSPLCDSCRVSGKRDELKLSVQVERMTLRRVEQAQRLRHRQRVLARGGFAGASVALGATVLNHFDRASMIACTLFLTMFWAGELLSRLGRHQASGLTLLGALAIIAPVWMLIAPTPLGIAGAAATLALAVAMPENLLPASSPWRRAPWGWLGGLVFAAACGARVMGWGRGAQALHPDLFVVWVVVPLLLILLRSATGHLFRRLEDALEESEQAHAQALALSQALAEVNGALSDKQRELERALEGMRHASQAKSRFVAHLSHEMRTPLHAVAGYTDLILEELKDLPHTSPRLLEDLRSIRQATDHLQSLINHVLDLSKIEAGKLTLHLEEVCLGQLARELEAPARALAMQRGNQFALHLQLAEARYVRLDRGRLRQILYNLLGNAAKFTSRGAITLRVSAAPSGDVCFSVEDSGVGIAADKLEAIFDRFEQAESLQLARRTEGAGLGLAISRELAQLMGLVLTVESEVGAGSCFTLRIPSSRLIEPRAPSR